MKDSFPFMPIYIGRRKNLPDFLPNMNQEDNIVVFLTGEEDIDGLSPTNWMEKHIIEPLRPRTDRNKKTGRYK